VTFVWLWEWWFEDACVSSDVTMFLGVDAEAKTWYVFGGFFCLWLDLTIRQVISGYQVMFDRAGSHGEMLPEDLWQCHGITGDEIIQAAVRPQLFFMQSFLPKCAPSTVWVADFQVFVSAKVDPNFLLFKVVFKPSVSFLQNFTEMHFSNSGFNWKTK